MGTSEVQMQHVLDDITFAILHQDGDVESILDQYPLVSRADVQAMMPIIRGMDVTLNPATPQTKFQRNLKRELLGRHARARTSGLPARVRVAAIVAVLAASLTLIWRILMFFTGSQRRKVEVADKKLA